MITSATTEPPWVDDLPTCEGCDHEGETDGIEFFCDRFCEWYDVDLAADGTLAACGCREAI